MMQTTLLQLLFSEQKISYILTDAQFSVIEYGGEPSVFNEINENPLPLSLLDFIPELNGCEDILQDILNGILPRFQLENLNRTGPEDEIHYLNLNIIPFEPSTTQENSSKLLVILSDTTAWAQSQQLLTQQRNELSLLKHSLHETNQRLEYILQYYVPREVSKALMENRITRQLGGEEREITILFADLRNYTSISEKLAPNETIEILHIYLDIATSAIAETGGVVVNYIGDAVMAIFNAPDDQPDHAHRAVKAALTLQAMAELYRKEQNSSGLPALHFGVGINTGKAVVGNVGAQWHYQYTAIGDTVNVASRICSHARPNEVLIGANTYYHVQDQVIAQPLPPLKFKGKSQEMTVYQVTDLPKDHALVEILKRSLL